MEQDKEILAKHLELIQGSISRLSQHAFVLKGWSVTLVAAIFALSAKDANERYAIIALLPGLVFWGLDGYYLWQERLFRELHNAVRKGGLQTDPYCMDVSAYKSQVPGWFAALWTPSVGFLHGVIVAAVLAVTIAAASSR